MLCSSIKTTNTSCCSEHCYLLKEARYAVWDLTNEQHYISVGDKGMFIKLAIERLLNLANFELAKYECSTL